jgi:dTDP-4-amino-4,6-dideoxygalactose transaminase
MSGREIDYIQRAHSLGHLAGDGEFTRRCHAWLEQQIGCHKALLTHSCTAALEMCAILLDLRPGDEVILPSFTFVSSANAFVLRGAVPVFVDIRPDTLNIDETQIEAAITPRTKAICVVHYAGVGCEMEAINSIARRYALKVVEDAAQGIMCAYRGKALGAIGDLGTLSFHETKNVISGEGGALLINDPAYIERAEIVREKGTNRSRFFRGEVDKYTWVDIGASYLPGELIAAFLAAQLEVAAEITTRRLAIWNAYHEWAERFEKAGSIRRPIIPAHCAHGGHIYHLLLPETRLRDAFIANLKSQGIGAVFHYVPLHSSPGGRRYGRATGPMTVTDDVSGRLVRLPLWIGLHEHFDVLMPRLETAMRQCGLC